MHVYLGAYADVTKKVATMTLIDRTLQSLDQIKQKLAAKCYPEMDVVPPSSQIRLRLAPHELDIEQEAQDDSTDPLDYLFPHCTILVELQGPSPRDS